MRTFMLIGTLVVVLAFSAMAAATASAAEILWKWLPGSVGETLKGSGGKDTLRATFKGSAFSLTCTKATLLLTDAELKVSSELVKEGSTEGKDATLALMIIHLEGCTIGGLAYNSEGDKGKSGVILMHIEAHNCMLAAGDFGVLLLLLPVHIEIPALPGVLLLLEGDLIGLYEGKEKEKLLTFGVNVKTTNKEGKEQELLKCKEGEKKELKASLDGKEFVPATEEVLEGKLEFDMTKDKEGEEMMEK